MRPLQILGEFEAMLGVRLHDIRQVIEGGAVPWNWRL
jgi:hypothetical protein